MVATILIGALLIAVLFLSFRRRKGPGGEKLLLFGPVGSGKTSLYLQLRFGRVVPTLTSMKKTMGTFALSTDQQNTSSNMRAVHVVDVPGTGRLKSQLLKEAASATVLCCVVDGTQIAAQAKQAAGLLFDVLSLETGTAVKPAS